MSLVEPLAAVVSLASGAHIVGNPLCAERLATKWAWRRAAGSLCSCFLGILRYLAGKIVDLNRHSLQAHFHFLESVLISWLVLRQCPSDEGNRFLACCPCAVVTPSQGSLASERDAFRFS